MTRMAADETVHALDELAAWPAGPGWLAVLGHPIAHSLSPRLHQGALEAMARLDPRFAGWRYVKFDVPPERLAEALGRFAERGFLGLNLTIPHKVLAASLLPSGDLESGARELGAVNTLHRTASGWRGHNTDGHGLAASLREELGAGFSGADVVVLGAGGAGRAAALQALRDGCRTLRVGNRSAERLGEVLDVLRPHAGGRVLEAFALGAPPALPEGALVLQCTSVGLRPGDPLPFPVEALPEGARVYDLVYGPRETPFVEAVRARGLRGASGLGMLVHQAARALEIWSGVDVPVAAMWGAVRR